MMTMVRQAMSHGRPGSGVFAGFLGAAMCLAGAAEAGCSAVGCARVDWTQLSDEQEAGPAAIGLHGAFATALPQLGWGVYPMPGHALVRCPEPVDAACRAALAALFDAAAAGVPLAYEADEGDDFGELGHELLPVFIADEENEPVALDALDARIVPAPAQMGRGACAVAFRHPLNAAPCPGDCDGSGGVAVNEIVRSIKLALGEAVRGCPGVDASGDGVVSVDEAVATVRRALEGCPAVN
jgi:hypothetical protein